MISRAMVDQKTSSLILSILCEIGMDCQRKKLLSKPALKFMYNSVYGSNSLV